MNESFLFSMTFPSIVDYMPETRRFPALTKSRRKIVTLSQQVNKNNEEIHRIVSKITLSIDTLFLGLSPLPE
jgi:hypothetical protein